MLTNAKLRLIVRAPVKINHLDEEDESSGWKYLGFTDLLVECIRLFHFLRFLKSGFWDPMENMGSIRALWGLYRKSYLGSAEVWVPNFALSFKL